MAGFSTAITGIQAASKDLDVIGNNIANASTVGFKSSRTEFGDIYASAVVGSGTSNIAGSGVTVTDIAQDFQAGTTDFTNNNLDLAIKGAGFFQLNDGQGGITYTRAGAFELDRTGNIVSKAGKHLQGYGLDAQGNRLPISNMQVTEKESPPKATESIKLAFNIDDRKDANKLSVPYNKDKPNTITFSTTMPSFDSLGNEHTIKYNMIEARPYAYVQTVDVDRLFTNPAGVAITDTTINGENVNRGQLTTGQAITYYYEKPSPTSSVVQAVEKANPENRIAPNAANQDIVDMFQDDPRIRKIEYTPGASTTSGRPEIQVTFFAKYQEPKPIHPTVDPAQTITQSAGEERTYEVYSATAATGAGKITIGGAEITVKAGETRDQIAKNIVASQDLIKNLNPAVEAITIGDGNRIHIKFKAENGDIPPESVPFTTTYGYTPAGGPAVTAGTLTTIEPATVRQGDNSFRGVYRMYAYLNGTDLLDIGMHQDPTKPNITLGVNEKPITEPGPILLEFNPSSGLLSKINNEDVTDPSNAPEITIKGADPANSATTIAMDLSGTTQFASASITKKEIQDGYTKGDLIGVTFGEKGEMVASFSNGQNKNLGIVAIATFENQAGLQPSGDTEWTATLLSGSAIVNPPGAGLNGKLRSAALEQSNVDLSSELVALIEAQRNFQANSKTIETQNTVTQAILKI